MSINLTDPIFTNEDAARKHFEAIRWPNGPVCPHCKAEGQATELKGKSTRPGVYKCRACSKPFTATIGTVYERSHIPLHKWLLATHLLCSSKKGMSAHQLFRMLGFGSYRTAWFMAHRIREGMTDTSHKTTGGLGGANKVVEVDESYVGGKAKNRAHREPAPKKAVLSLVERNGRVASFHVANVTAKTVRPLIVTNASRASALMTDESPIYPRIGKEFSSHGTVNHSANEYARLAGYMHTNTAENFFSILKRGITGVYHSVSEAHLHRYLAEFDFRYNNRSGLGVEDAERAMKAVRGTAGKRLTYRQAH
ncbi:IS1595 family transposase [Phreatobacter sp.]|uniref:IS1595 family transposase n=1 Tax=Phreatobacter sp. TaxID=1966341 RepID=UPI003F7155D0